MVPASWRCRRIVIGAFLQGRLRDLLLWSPPTKHGRLQLRRFGAFTKGAVVENALAKSVKLFAYVVVLLMIVGIVYAAYISIRYFHGIGV